MSRELDYEKTRISKAVDRILRRQNLPIEAVEIRKIEVADNEPQFYAVVVRPSWQTLSWSELEKHALALHNGLIQEPDKAPFYVHVYPRKNTKQDGCPTIEETTEMIQSVWKKISGSHVGYEDFWKYPLIDVVVTPKSERDLVYFLILETPLDTFDRAFLSGDKVRSWIVNARHEIKQALRYEFEYKPEILIDFLFTPDHLSLEKHRG